MKIVIPDPIWGIPEKYWDQLRGLGADVYKELPTDQAETARRIKDAEIITVNYLDGNRQLIDAAPHLKYIVSPAVGYEWIDIGYATSKGIKVLNCPTFVPLSVAEHALALLFALARRLPEARADLEKGIWLSNKYTGMEVAGKTLGLVGYGNVGHHLERMVKGLGMKVIWVNSKSTAVEIDDLLRASDVVCLCLPLNKSTHHMIDKRRLGLLKKTAYLLNVARGAIVDQAALLEALQGQDFAGAGLDVFEGEPDAEGEISDQIRALVGLPNVVATPHSAFNTPETLDRKGAEILSDIQSCLAGRPQNMLN